MITFKHNGYRYISIPGRLKVYNEGYMLEHRCIAEAVLGKPLLRGVKVHHHGARDDNTQLVICENEEYHALLHTRTRALKACGYVGWRKCRFCKQHDEPGNLYISPDNRCVHHRTCFNAWQRRQRRF